MANPLKLQNNYIRSLLLGALVGVGIALIFAGGFFFHEIISPQPLLAFSDKVLTAGDYPLLNEVESLLDQHYLRELPDITTRQYAAIRGVLGTLDDRYTFFIEPPVAQSESDVLAGTYGGIGALIQRSETGEFVLFPFPDGPAAKAGIQDGDILRVINGSVIEISQQQDSVDQMLRGEVKEGNGVEITVNRTDKGEFTVFILFDVINVPSVVWRTLLEDERIGYVHIANFTNRTPSELADALQALRSEGISAIILDLRENRGGLLQESISVASEFLDGGVVVYQVSQDSERTFSAEQGGLATDLPLAVLINANTASAAELVAGAIKDYGRGFIIGQTSFGKGTVQQIFPLSDGSSVHITSAEFLTPNRNALDKVGLEPDVSMIPDENGRDIEIGEAIRYLQTDLLANGSES